MTQQVINGERLNRSLEELGRIGHTPQGMQRVGVFPAGRRGVGSIRFR